MNNDPSEITSSDLFSYDPSHFLQSNQISLGDEEDYEDDEDEGYDSDNDTPSNAINFNEMLQQIPVNQLPNQLPNNSPNTQLPLGMDNLPPGIKVIQISPDQLRNLPELLQGKMPKVPKIPQHIGMTCNYGNDDKMSSILPASSIDSSIKENNRVKIQELPVVKTKVPSKLASKNILSGNDLDSNSSVSTSISTMSEKQGGTKNLWKWL